RDGADRMPFARPRRRTLALVVELEPSRELEREEREDRVARRAMDGEPLEVRLAVTERRRLDLRDVARRDRRPCERAGVEATGDHRPDRGDRLDDRRCARLRLWWMGGDEQRDGEREDVRHRGASGRSGVVAATDPAPTLPSRVDDAHPSAPEPRPSMSIPTPRHAPHPLSTVSVRSLVAAVTIGAFASSALAQGDTETLLQRARAIHERVMTLDTHVDINPSAFRTDGPNYV